MKKSFLLIMVSTLLFSCQKKAAEEHFPATESVDLTDSTKLIKIIKYTIQGEEVYTDTYTYHNELTRTVLINTEDKKYGNGTITLFYTPQGQLKEYRYSGQERPGNEISNALFEYDNDGIIQRISSTYNNGNSATLNFQKKAIAGGGFSLSWNNNSLQQRYVVFNPAGIPVLNQQTDLYESNGKTHTYIVTDSLFYTEKQLHKIITAETSTEYNWKKERISLSIGERFPAGNQLFNHFQSLFNGVTAIPFTAYDKVPERLYNILSPERQAQLFPFPAKRARVRSASTDFLNNATITADRLIKTNIAAAANTVESYSISYYK